MESDSVSSPYLVTELLFILTCLLRPAHGLPGLLFLTHGTDDPHLLCGEAACGPGVISHACRTLACPLDHLGGYMYKGSLAHSWLYLTLLS